MSSLYNTSNVLRKDASDIFEQIRKKAEDISTSEGSFRVFHNLSNPTNLTNPQIISIRRVDNSNISKSNNRLNKARTRNRLNQFKYDKSTIESTKNELHDQLLMNEQIKRLILKKKQKYAFDINLETQKQNTRHFFNLTQKMKLPQKIKKNRTLETIGEEGTLKAIRVNKRNHITARDYISTSRNIQLLRFLRKNKIEEINMLTNMQKSEMDTLTSNIESLETNKETIITNYNIKYVSYVNFLIKQKDKEERKNIDLIIETSKIRKEILQIQTKINKVQNEKTEKLNLILLLIQIKERIRKLPEMAYKLFGTSDNPKNLKHKTYIQNNPKEFIKKITFKKQISSIKFQEKIKNSEELKKILKYKGKIIYNDLYEFEYDYNQLELKIRNKIEYNENIKQDVQELKTQLNLIKSESEHDPNEEKEKRLHNILNDLKFINEELNSELVSIKIRFNINTNKNQFKSRNNFDTKNTRIKHSFTTNNINKHLELNKINNTKTSNNFFNTLLTSDSNTIYSPQTILSFKKYFTIEGFDFSKASNLFFSCYALYNLTKENLFQEEEIKYNIDVKRGFSFEPEKATILKMIEYIDNIVTLLIKQKNMYLENNHLRKKYEKIQELLEEEKRRNKFIDGLKKDQEKRRLKLKKLNRKKDKLRYISFRKVENKYFFKAQKEQIKRAIDLAELKRTPNFEDFMFDVLD